MGKKMRNIMRSVSAIIVGVVAASGLWLARAAASSNVTFIPAAQVTAVIYMLEGTTTFVTGGTMVGGMTSAPGEIRGSSVNGGETRTLTKGDVIIVPNGTPHWFKNVSGPVLYYVVKVQ